MSKEAKLDCFMLFLLVVIAAIGGCLGWAINDYHDRDLPRGCDVYEQPPRVYVTDDSTVMIPQYDVLCTTRVLWSESDN